MASPCEILCWAQEQAHAAHAMAAAAEEVRRIEAKYSRYRQDSVIGQINAQAGRAPVAVDAETSSLLDYAHAVWTLSAGAFDPTSGVLRRVWDFKSASLPEAESIAALLPLVGWPKLHRDGATVRLELPGMELDFGGFGKEYACDRAAAVLQQHGLQHALVNLGGDVRVLGPQADGRPWRIGIQHPRQPETLIASIDLSAGALATSGDYQRYFELAGRRYCHLLDARSGWPVADCAQSLSIVAPLCLVAGTAATCGLLAGAQGWQTLEGRDFLWIGAVERSQFRQHGPFELQCPALRADGTL